MWLGVNGKRRGEESTIHIWVRGGCIGEARWLVRDRGGGGGGDDDDDSGRGENKLPRHSTDERARRRRKERELGREKRRS